MRGLRSVLAGLNSHITESFRILVMQAFLAPAAYLLPSSWAFGAAKALALPLAVLPSPGLTAYRRMRRAFGQGRWRSFQLAWGWIARPFQDFVMHKRVLYGRENIFGWRIEEKNADEVRKLRESGQSFILATGHFERAALLAIASPCITPGNLIQVTHAPPKQVHRPYDLRLRLQFGTFLKTLSTAWRRPFEFAYTNTDQSAARLLYERLKLPGNVVSISLDAPWPARSSGSYCRPFAGKRERRFSTGATQLAKLTQSPVVSCVCWREDDGSVVLEWGSPIHHVENEIDTMNTLIDTLEAAIGQRPTQYVLEIGGERRWNAALGRWENL
ncbi:Lauroyl/myristoyl acyltransferase [Terricaulis silvestris]|uniref:Lauroyl/myristoyl acyltransferase n=2 Tax=Terricaulis silvestris TaxID=2686094 RepID=A0A6I6MLC5_9CAUL|nr:Lauroyl/myristoyl acyltransferase [Terricaulis silvestris]